MQHVRTECDMGRICLERHGRTFSTQHSLTHHSYLRYPDQHLTNIHAQSPLEHAVNFKVESDLANLIRHSMHGIVHRVTRENGRRMAMWMGTVHISLQHFQWCVTGQRGGQHDSRILEGPNQNTTMKDMICKQYAPTLPYRFSVGD